MDSLGVISLFLLTVGWVKCHADTQVQAQSGYSGQGSSFFLMQHVFKLEGKVETQLKHVEEDIEELKSKADNCNGPSNGKDVAGEIETMKSEIESLSEEFQNVKGENLNLEAKVSQLQGSNSDLQESNAALHRSYSALQKSNSELQNAVSRLQSSGLGITYVRWGRTVCPQGSETVYKGYVGGGHYTNTGAAVNYLCLTDDPEWAYYDSHQSAAAHVYGAEYEFGSRHSDGGSKFFGQNLHSMDAPCVVCRPPRSSLVMIPGRKTCFTGWTLEFSGYLVGGADSHKASSEFICLDGRAEAEDAGITNHNGILFYIAAGKCGSLNCPPYVDERQLTCVVCSR